MTTLVVRVLSAWHDYVEVPPLSYYQKNKSFVDAGSFHNVTCMIPDTTRGHRLLHQHVIVATNPKTERLGFKELMLFASLTLFAVAVWAPELDHVLLKGLPLRQPAMDDCEWLKLKSERIRHQTAVIRTDRQVSSLLRLEEEPPPPHFTLLH
ncbi:hypothetical protein BC941DRAFT_506667 [Chlamydoabsidia padenii]|nr:hypothetical protein BC941DRAFT_506667 [Chlamydoabsidia padenii]